LLRALYLHHPQDKICRHIDDQYYFGENMLVAPVMNSEGIRDVYLPEGEWVHFFSRRKYSGGRWIKAMEVPLDEMPVFVKAGSSIPLYPEKVSCTDEMDMDKVIREQF
jgi:alpha-D-xyloside xylohydrolase